MGILPGSITGLTRHMPITAIFSTAASTKQICPPPDSYGYFANPIALFSMLRLFDDAMPLSARISCKHSVETKTVPSEDGGERKITITRC